MEVIIQATTDQPDDESLLKSWATIKPLLKENYDIHEYTIYYWCDFNADDLNDCWQVTPYIRQLYDEKKT